MKDTSKKSYDEEVSSHRIYTVRDWVYIYIKNNPGCSRKDIANNSRISLQSVCARVHELIKVNAVEEYNKKFDPQTNKTVYCLRKYKNSGQLNLF